MTAPRAHAQDDASVAMARERFKEGVQFFDQRQYDKARAAFLQAYALKRHPAVLLNLAQSELRAGHEADAAKHFAQYLREHKEATDAERQGAEAGLAAAKALVAELTVSIDEDGATVIVDGTAEGGSPLAGPLYLGPGTHSIAARKDGREVSLQITATAGQSSTTNLRFKKLAAAPAAAAPSRTDEEAAPIVEPQSSEPELDVEDEDAGGPKSFAAWSASSPIAWIGGALTIGGIAGGIGFAVAAKNSYDSANSVAMQIRQEADNDGISPNGICASNSSTRPTGPRGDQFLLACGRYSDNVDKGDNFKTFSIAGWVIAGVAATGTVVAYLADGSEEESSALRASRRASAQVVPWVSAAGPGLSVFGEF